MKETYLFEYIRQDTPLGRMNPLLKLIVLILFCTASGLIRGPLLAVPAAILIILLIRSPKIVKKQLKNMWKLILFFAAMGVVKFFNNRSITEAVSFSAGLIMMAIAGLLFYTSTSILSLKKKLPRSRLSEMVIMATAFLPLVFKTASELDEARKSRCFNGRKNIFRTIRFSAIPLMINMLIKTEEMADAWYSRCYNTK